MFHELFVESNWQRSLFDARATGLNACCWPFPLRVFDPRSDCQIRHLKIAAYAKRLTSRISFGSIKIMNREMFELYNFLKESKMLH